MSEVRLEHKHPWAIRWFHWINFPVLTLVIWSGLLIYWAHDVYRVGIGNWTVFHFFPNWFYDTLTVSGRLAEGMAGHFLLMWLFLVNGLLYVAYTAISGAWRYLAPNRNPFREALQVMLYDLHLSKVHPPPREVQRRATGRLFEHHSDGCGLFDHRLGDFQADAVFVACFAAGRRAGGTLGTLLAGGGICSVLLRACGTGGEGGLE